MPGPRSATNVKDLVAAGVTLAVGVFFVVHGYTYPLGTASRMGAGFFPVVLGFVAIGLSALLLVRALRTRDSIEPVPWRAFTSVILSVALFGLLLPYLGLVPATMAAALVAAAGDPASRPVPALACAGALAAASWLLFIHALGLPLVPFRWAF